MEKINQVVFDMEEYGNLTNSVSTARVSLEKIIDALNTRECSNDDVCAWLSSTAFNLRLAEDILRD